MSGDDQTASRAAEPASDDVVSHIFQLARSNSIRKRRKDTTVFFLVFPPTPPCLGQLEFAYSMNLLIPIALAGQQISRLLGLQLRCSPRGRISAPYHNPPEHFARKTYGRRDERAATVGYLHKR